MRKALQKLVQDPCSFVLKFSMASPEELLGLINGRARAIREQHQSSKQLTSCTQVQINELSKAMAELSRSVHSQPSSSNGFHVTSTVRMQLNQTCVFMLSETSLITQNILFSSKTIYPMNPINVSPLQATIQTLHYRINFFNKSSFPSC